MIVIASIGKPWWLRGKESAFSAGNADLISGLQRFPGEGNGNPLQYSCLGNTRDRGARQAIIHGVAKNQDTTQRLNNKEKESKQKSTASSLRKPSTVGGRLPEYGVRFSHRA